MVACYTLWLVITTCMGMCASPHILVPPTSLRVLCLFRCCIHVTVAIKLCEQSPSRDSALTATSDPPLSAAHALTAAWGHAYLRVIIQGMRGKTKPSIIQCGSLLTLAQMLLCQISQTLLEPPMRGTIFLIICCKKSAHKLSI